MSLSKDYVTDSESDEEQVFTVPKNYQKVVPTKLPTNKEIWLIKAPKGFNFDKLSKMPLSFNPMEESNPLEQNGKTFVIQEDLTDLVSEGAKFKVIGDGMRDIKRFYNVREKVKIPSINYDKVVKPRKDVRKVNGLQKQHFATGYGRATGDETSDVEVDEDVDMDTTPVKKEKKDKKDKKEKKEKKEKKRKADDEEEEGEKKKKAKK